MEFKITELVATTISGITLWAFNIARQSNSKEHQLKANQEYAKLFNYLKSKPENMESIKTICEKLNWSQNQLKRVVKRAPFRFHFKGKCIRVDLLKP
ncbi:hypothetical protein [Pseudoalteromonas piratica]|uniref:Uncharacterized protein n=1 Tax=Pseudoalteromonas piratica TaxID=1348114 RepID=A0A0A7EBE3_9GAMM|nr:hypothetical protein [Pseudoalteromonas piratica]AIY63940.1 hypothetical protein OM33_01290 [Pseudoalteromonas piratica]